MSPPYSYEQSVKSRAADELINTYVLRPAAGLIVRLLYHTFVTPNQVTVASTVAGLFAAYAFLQGDPGSVATAGLLVTLKDLLDSADGQLARAKNLYSRNGRFLDSIGDFVAHLAIFAAIGWMLYKASGDIRAPVLAAAAFLGLSLRVSYHVYYQAAFLHLEGQYENNRLVEGVTEEDKRGDAATLRLQRIFQFLYGWQDRLILAVDRWCRKGNDDAKFLETWYANRAALRLSGFVGLGTELFLLMLCSLFNHLNLYLYLNLFLMNAVALAAIVYRRLTLAQN
ncbi:MAG: CDP-alcohol phosphatidyltransferase family protein [Bacteroidota bacterium]